MSLVDDYRVPEKKLEVVGEVTAHFEDQAILEHMRNQAWLYTFTLSDGTKRRLTDHSMMLTVEVENGAGMVSFEPISGPDKDFGFLDYAKVMAHHIHFGSQPTLVYEGQLEKVDENGVMVELL